MSSDPVLVPPGTNFIVKRHILGGWSLDQAKDGTTRTIAFTDSVDLLDWLGEVLITSDGGKRSPMKDNSLKEYFLKEYFKEEAKTPVPKTPF